MLLLSRRDLEAVLGMGEAIRVVEEAFRLHGLGEITMPQRTVLNPKGGRGWFAIMPAYAEKWGVLTVKAVASYPENPSRGLPTINALTLHVDGETGTPLALMEAGYLTALRTGAVGGVAAKYLARPEAEAVGLLGSGEQAWRQLEALTYILPSISHVKVYSPTPQHRVAFAGKASELFRVKVEAVDSPGKAVEGCDLVVAATSALTPVVQGKWLGDGVHVTSVGTHHPDRREIDGETVVRAKVVVDSREACLKEAGDLIIPLREGLITEEHVYAELGEIVAEIKPGRASPREITFFKSVGLALQDLAVAKLAYEKAKKLGVGLEFSPA